MNKTININLAGIIFHLDEEAYKKLTAYLQSIKDRLKGDPGQEEIIADIEARVAELFQEKLGKGKEVINTADVEEVMAVMGNPEDYESEEEDNSSTYSQSDSYKSYTSENTYSFGRKLFRNTDDKVFGGVASGLGAYFGIDAVWIRLIWVFLFFTWGTGFLLYIILWIVIPEAVTTSQKLQMKGEPINVSNIERSVKNVGDKVGSIAKDPKLGNKIGNFVERVLNALLSILKFILKFAFKILGVALIILGILILISFIGAIFGHEIVVMDNMFGLVDVSGYIDRILVAEDHHGLAIIGVLMMMVAPVVWLILGGAKLLFNYRSVSKVPFVGSGLVSLAGFMIVGYIALSLGRDFRSFAKATKIHELQVVNSNTYFLSVNDIRPFEEDEYNEDLEWVVSDEGHYNSDIELDVLKSDEGYAYVKETYSAHGRTKKEARDRAKAMGYDFEQKDSLILFDDYFKMDSEEKYRKQSLKITVFIPVGSSIYLDQDMREIIYDIENVTNTRDNDMLGHTWLMTQSGLICTDCGSNFFKEENSEDYSDFEEQWEEEADQLEKARKQLEKERRKLEEFQEIEKLQREIEELQRQNERLQKEQSKNNRNTKTRFTENQGFHSPLYIQPVNSPTIVDHNQNYGTQV